MDFEVICNQNEFKFRDKCYKLKEFNQIYTIIQGEIEKAKMEMEIVKRDITKSKKVVNEIVNKRTKLIADSLEDLNYVMSQIEASKKSDSNSKGIFANAWDYLNSFSIKKGGNHRRRKTNRRKTNRRKTNRRKTKGQLSL